ncbi:30S ribosomal protein S8 [Candidatus Curtissbacteria bacterium]|nr:30S ribosomal protein S8 [Candidatus Curtissbacteria bacterium]
MDPVSDFLITIKNGYMAKKDQVVVPHSKFKMAIARVLEEENFIKKAEKKDRSINIELLYQNGKPRISTVKRVSKPGLRFYAKSKSIKIPRGGRGLTIVSTPQGVMAGRLAKEKKLGGEVICQIW